MEQLVLSSTYTSNNHRLVWYHLIIQSVLRYIFKGSDRGRVVAEPTEGEEINECTNYVDGRYIGAHEALWSNKFQYVYL